MAALISEYDQQPPSTPSRPPEKIKGKISVQRFKGLGEMNPLQLRETTIHPDTRRLVQLTLDAGDETYRIMDMLLARKRAGDRKEWLQAKGDLAEV